MQTCFRHRLLSFTTIFLLTLTTASAQSLARPGWSGNGLAPEPWWQHAVFYRIDQAPLPTLAELPSLQAFGIDAVLLTPPSIQPQPPAPDSPNAPLDLDDFLFQCARLHIHVLVPLDLAAPDADPGKTLALVRSWLYRGAAGFVVSGLDQLQPAIPPTSSTNIHPNHHNVQAIHLAAPAPEPQILHELRQIVAQFPGDHILIGPNQNPSFQLQIATLAPTPDPARLASLNSQTSPRVLLSMQNPVFINPIDATRLLVTSAPAILDSAAIPPALLLHVFPPLARLTAPPPVAKPAPLPPNPNVYTTFTPYVPKNTYADQQRKLAETKAAKAAAAEKAVIDAETFPVQSDFQPVADTPTGQVAFYHHLIQLHRANAALQDGTLHPLETASPTTFAWVSTHGNAPPLVVVCNPSAAAVTVNLSHALRGIANSSEMLRTLLHTASTSGVVDPSAVPIGAQGIYAGILAHGYVYR
jgi:hypothetical protein